MSLLNQAKSDLYITINEVKEEFIKGRKKHEDSLYDRASRAEVNSERTAEELVTVRKEVEDLRNLCKDVEKDTVEYAKSMYESSRKEMKHNINALDGQLAAFKTEITHRVDNSLLTAEFEKYKEDIAEVIREKVDVEEVQNAITGCQTDTVNRITALKQDLLKNINELSISFKQILEDKVDLDKLENRLTYMVSKEEFNSELENFSHNRDTERIADQIGDLYRLVDQKTDHKEFLNEKEKVNLIIESLENDLATKVNAEEARNLIDQKCNIDDVNKALTEVHNELDTKASLEDYEAHVSTQSEINQALCAENCVARWIWKSGDLKNGFAVPWEVESINTCPENFLWEQDKANIMTVAPGLYEVIFGFYSKKKPAVQLLVNGEPLLSAVNSSSYVVHHSSGKLKSSGKHKEGNIGGLTLIDFVALPARARISVSFSGESAAEGFIGLRKL